MQASDENLRTAGQWGHGQMLTLCVCLWRFRSKLRVNARLQTEQTFNCLRDGLLRITVIPYVWLDYGSKYITMGGRTSGLWRDVECWPCRARSGVG